MAYWPHLAVLGIAALVWFWEKRRPAQVARIEENILAILLALITLVSFTQVIARYGFNTGWTGALEFTRILFAWMILFGMSYGVKHGMHLGVDALIRLFPPKLFKLAAMFGALSIIVYALIIIDASWLALFGADSRGGAIEYWSKMFKVGIGLDDLRYPEWMQDTLGVQERVQRWIAYLILPVGLGLLAFRGLQALVAIARGERELVIAGHEAEELVAENKDVLRD